MTDHKEIIFKIGSEGGALTISRIVVNGQAKFIFSHLESDFTEEGLDIHNKMICNTFEEAFQRMDNYFWPNLNVLFIHPKFHEILKIKLMEKLNSDPRIPVRKIRRMSSFEDELNIRLICDETSGWTFTVPEKHT